MSNSASNSQTQTVKRSKQFIRENFKNLLNSTVPISICTETPNQMAVYRATVKIKQRKMAATRNLFHIGTRKLKFVKNTTRKLKLRSCCTTALLLRFRWPTTWSRNSLFGRWSLLDSAPNLKKLISSRSTHSFVTSLTRVWSSLWSTQTCQSNPFCFACSIRDPRRTSTSHSSNWLVRPWLALTFWIQWCQFWHFVSIGLSIGQSGPMTLGLVAKGIKTRLVLKPKKQGAKGHTTISTLTQVQKYPCTSPMPKYSKLCMWRWCSDSVFQFCSHLLLCSSQF